MPIQQPDIARSMIAAGSMARTNIALKDYAKKSQEANSVKSARDAASNGDPDAIKALQKLDPAGAGQIINNLASMDEAGRKEVKANAERMAKAITYVMQGEGEETRAQRWDETVDFMVKAGDDGAAEYKGKYSPDLAQHLLFQAMTIDDLNDQFAFGQLKVGMKDGKPVYLQTNPAGQTREAPVPKGVSPTDKEAYGKSGSGAGSGGSLKAADENSMKSSVASLYGGTYDPQSGRISGIEKGQEKNALAVSARATRIYSDANGSKTRTESAAEAARELGIAVPKVQAKSIKDYLSEQREQ